MALTILAFGILAFGLMGCATTGGKGPWGYPPAPRGDVVDDYHGTPVADPYRWLEDPDSPETQAFLQAEKAITERFLHKPGWQKLKDRVGELQRLSAYGGAKEVAGRIYFTQSDGVKNQPLLMAVAADSPKDQAQVVLDPNSFAADGTAALSDWAVSPDGKLLAYARSEGGSDQQIIRLRDLNSGRDLPETLRHCKFAHMDWKDDGSGFFYNRYPDPAGKSVVEQHQHNKIFFHVPGQAQADDRLIFESADPDLLLMGSCSQDGRYLVVHGYRGTSPRNRVWVVDLKSQAAPVALFDQEDASVHFIENIGTTFYFMTDRDAPRFRVVAVDLDKPEPNRWREVIASGDDTLASVDMINHRFIVTRMHHARSLLDIHDLNGRLTTRVALPGLGSVSAVSGRRSGTRFCFGFQSFLQPASILRFSFEGEGLETLRQGQAILPSADFISEQIFITSKDGTAIPVFVIRPKTAAKDDQTPLLLYGYGGFNISLTPGFRSRWLPWLDRGGSLAVANLRGGGEYGEQWHAAGTLGQKQNVFDDFIAVAEGLIERRYTRKDKLAIIGGSNGGLLTAACMLQRPDLFGAVISAVPVTDMLRYTLFTVGRFWVSDYGDAKKSPEQFKFLYAYSPLHNVKEGVAYPPLLVTTAEGDDRVVPAHATKFIAAVQHADGGQNPLLLRVEGKAGHGHGKPTAKQIDEYADMYSFLFQVLEMGL